MSRPLRCVRCDARFHSLCLCLHGRYPDNDPLLVRVDMRENPPNHLPRILDIKDIEPARVLVEIDDHFRYMMRVDGLDHAL